MKIQCDDVHDERIQNAYKQCPRMIITAFEKYDLNVKSRKYLLSICDMIKRNESDFGHIVFEILAKTVFKFLCFILFLALSNPS